jgi:hypothetical protein
MERLTTSLPWRGRRSVRIILTVALIGALLLVLALGAGESAAAGEAAGVLQLDAMFTYSPPSQIPSRVACPTGAPSIDQCFQFSGHAAIPAWEG